MLLEEAYIEATELRSALTQEERDRLNYEVLDPLWVGRCLYSMLTGASCSKRAVHLVNTCAVSCQGPYRLGYPRLGVDERDPSHHVITQLEAAIRWKSMGNKSILNYLKGGKLSLDEYLAKL